MGEPVSEKPRSWNEIRNASVEFVRRFQDETDENAEAQSCWTEFLGMFGIDRKRVNAIFEDRAHRSDPGGRGRIDMFWPGQIAVEHKSKGKPRCCDAAVLDVFGLVTAFLPAPQFGVCPHRDGACDPSEDGARLSTIDQLDFYSCSRIQCRFTIKELFGAQKH